MEVDVEEEEEEDEGELGQRGRGETYELNSFVCDTGYLSGKYQPLRHKKTTILTFLEFKNHFPDWQFLETIRKFELKM